MLKLYWCNLVGNKGRGLSRFDDKTKNFANHRPISCDSRRLNGEVINILHEDRTGTLWGERYGWTDYTGITGTTTRLSAIRNV
jgi:hypothetical protein